jgi:hypothetical protein
VALNRPRLSPSVKWSTLQASCRWLAFARDVVAAIVGTESVEDG